MVMIIGYLKFLTVVKIYIFNEMKKQNIPEEIFSLITEEEIIMFQELQIKIK